MRGSRNVQDLRSNNVLPYSAKPQARQSSTCHDVIIDATRRSRGASALKQVSQVDPRWSPSAEGPGFHLAENVQLAPWRRIPFLALESFVGWIIRYNEVESITIGRILRMARPRTTPITQMTYPARTANSCWGAICAGGHGSSWQIASYGYATSAPP
jgi:hypothetical protein